MKPKCDATSEQTTPLAGQVSQPARQPNSQPESQPTVEPGTNSHKIPYIEWVGSTLTICPFAWALCCATFLGLGAWSGQEGDQEWGVWAMPAIWLAISTLLSQVGPTNAWLRLRIFGHYHSSRWSVQSSTSASCQGNLIEMLHLFSTTFVGQQQRQQSCWPAEVLNLALVVLKVVLYNS